MTASVVDKYINTSAQQWKEKNCRTVFTMRYEDVGLALDSKTVTTAGLTITDEHFLM